MTSFRSVDSASSVCRRIEAAWLIYVALIVYGSLLPFDFQPRPFQDAWREFLDTPYLRLGVGARADWIANIVLYLPLGFLAGAWGAVSPRFGKWVGARTIFLLLLGALVATAVEFTQLYFRPRTVSLNDLLAEGLGLAGGALIWIVAGTQVSRLWRKFVAGGYPAMVAGLSLYALAYVAISLFPYDLLVSSPELSWKLEKGRLDWLLVSSECGVVLRCLSRLTVEILAAVPIGVLLGAALRNSARPGYGIAVLAGLLLGGALEGMQVFLASGVSQGASVITRAVGLVAGLALFRSADVTLVRQVKRYARLLVVVSGGLYLTFLPILHGWHSGEWLSVTDAQAKLSTLRFIPFFYHYFVPEAVALKSALQQAAMYLPLGAACWLWALGSRRHGQPRAGYAAVLAAIVAVVVEGSKLFLEGERPDPTNILIAAGSAAMVVVVAQWISRSSREVVLGSSTATASDVQTAQSAGGATDVAVAEIQKARSLTAASTPGFFRWTLAAGLALATIWLVAKHPVHSVWLAAALLAYATALLRYPWLWLVIVPASLPLLDFSPVTGWLLVNEFDLLLLTTITVFVARGWPVSVPAYLPSSGMVLLALLGVSYLISAVHGVLPLEPLDANGFSSYFSNYNSLRVAKGFAWALALLPLLKAALSNRERALRYLSTGMLLGLAGAISAVFLERHLFSGELGSLQAFESDGMLPGTHLDDVAVQTYIAVTLPIVFYWVEQAQGKLAWVIGAVLLALASYAIYLTFMPFGYIALLVSLIILSGAFRIVPSRTSEPRHRRVIRTPLILLVLIFLAFGVLIKSSEPASRWQDGLTDWRARLAHARSVLNIMPGDWATRVFGMGLGTFPEHYLWEMADSSVIGTHRFASDKNNGYLQLGGGELLYVHQRLALEPDEDHTLSLNVRSNASWIGLHVLLCRQALLSIGPCQRFQIGPMSAEDAWQTQVLTFKSGRAGSPWYRKVSLALGFYNEHRYSIIGVDDVSLVNTKGQQLIRNGNFLHGSDHWFFSVDSSRPWHVGNLWAALYFDQGWLGVLAFTGIVLYAFAAILRRPRSSTRGSDVACASIAAFLVMGMAGSPLDFPRLATLFYMIVFTLILTEPLSRSLILPEFGSRKPAE